ncbi:MAG: cell wall anchor protein, partial [Pseudonocardiaceae bacterium]
MNATPRDKLRDGTPASGSEAASLVESAMLLRWRAPELALLLADRAVAAAGEDRVTVLRADHLAVFALNRLERYAQAVHRLLPAIRDADTPAELRSELQVELAHCAVGLGEPATALAAVRPVLAAGEDVAPVLRGAALVIVAESSDAFGRDDVVACALEEADELFREDQHLDRDTALLLRATAKAVNAVHHRRGGAAAEAEAQARAGCDLLTGLADSEHDSG